MRVIMGVGADGLVPAREVLGRREDNAESDGPLAPSGELSGLAVNDPRGRRR